MATVLNNPIIVVDDINVKVVPNSVSYNDGDGEVTTRTQTTGNTVEVIQSVNAETKIGMVKFSVISTPENADLIRTWRRSAKAHTVDLAQTGTDFSRSFPQMRISNNPDTNIGHDAVVEIEFHGNRAA